MNVKNRMGGLWTLDVHSLTAVDTVPRGIQWQLEATQLWIPEEGGSPATSSILFELEPYLEIWGPLGYQNNLSGRSMLHIQASLSIYWLSEATVELESPGPPSQGSKSSPAHLGSDTKGSSLVSIHSCVQFPQGISSTEGGRDLG